MEHLAQRRSINVAVVDAMRKLVHHKENPVGS
jgi:hypothetical protein